MKFVKEFVPSLLSCTLAMASAVEAGPLHQPFIKPRQTNETIPKNFGVVVFRAMLMQDMVGVVDPLQVLAHEFPMNLYILSSTTDPVTTEPSSGPGVRAPDVSPMTNFIRDRYPKLRYLLTVCTGAGLAAKSGVLDGRKATTNKQAWASITAYGPNTTWVSPARWVVDGNIWTSSGATAGLDLAFAWIEHIWGKEWAEYVEGREEYVPHPQDFDPFAAKFNITPNGSL
ncbi:DJ-1/PfpI family protein [Xylaria castorea]|nr:DJ-1/PfpI family protein [Xylaria castorea]